MKSIDEVVRKRFEYAKPKRLTYEPLIKQALDWALEKMKDKNMSHYAEFLIRERIMLLEEKQSEIDPQGFATRPARFVLINALKWVVDEYEFES